ncbi:hypothetical protein B0I37DRAFT_428606 [Chaetomium sp. MPI-CAGE-AT-0009]|nr:hypothetical protein B0I37DRAFT_428606 [Chaetomium sp. MPI-CAGE-AT-0009]
MCTKHRQQHSCQHYSTKLDKLCGIAEARIKDNITPLPYALYFEEKCTTHVLKLARGYPSIENYIENKIAAQKIRFITVRIPKWEADTDGDGTGTIYDWYPRKINKVLDALANRVADLRAQQHEANQTEATLQDGYDSEGSSCPGSFTDRGSGSSCPGSESAV